jgi:hypothetical protein
MEEAAPLKNINIQAKPTSEKYHQYISKAIGNILLNFCTKIFFKRDFPLSLPYLYFLHTLHTCITDDVLLCKPFRHIYIFKQ